MPRHVSPARAGALGFRKSPGRVALAVFGLMPVLYRLHLGRLLGHQFILVAHRGRRSGRRYETALKVITHDRRTGEVIVFSMYGPSAGWMRNITATPALEVQTGGRRFAPRQRFLTEEEAFEAADRFRREHSRQLRLFATVLGWGRLRFEGEIRAFVHGKPFVAFAPSRSDTGGPPGIANDGSRV